MNKIIVVGLTIVSLTLMVYEVFVFDNLVFGVPMIFLLMSNMIHYLEKWYK